MDGGLGVVVVVLLRAVIVLLNEIKCGAFASSCASSVQLAVVRVGCVHIHARHIVFLIISCFEVTLTWEGRLVGFPFSLARTFADLICLGGWVSCEGL